MRRARGVELLLTLLGVLLLCVPAPAGAQSKNKKNKRLENRLAKISKKLGVPVDALRKVGGERYTARKAKERRALLGEIAKNPLPDLVPLVVAVALRDKDLDCRHSALRLISVVGLEADRDAYLEHIHPALGKLHDDKFERIYLESVDEANVLARWFQLDKEIVDQLTKVFDGEHYRKAVKAYRGLLALKHPELRDGVAQRALREALDRRSRFAVFERKQAVTENGRRGKPWTPKQLGSMVVEDGTIAVECANAVGDLGDPVALPFLRKINRTGAHVLRIPALIARGKLGDESLLKMIEPTFESDHVNIRIALVAALAELPRDHPKVDKVLARLPKIAQDEAKLLQAIALARLKRGDATDIALVAEQLEGATPNVALARQVLAIEHQAVEPLVVQIAGNGAKPLTGQRLRAVERIGEDGIDTDDARKALREAMKPIDGEEKTALRLHAAASFLQLKPKKGQKMMTEALEDFDVVTREDVKTPCGLARRFKGSPLNRVAQRLGRSKTIKAIPLMAPWLDPPDPDAEPAPAKDDAKKDGEEPEKEEEETTQERGKKKKSTGEPPSEAEPAKLPPWLEHQFVRRAVVESLGKLAVAAKEAEEKKLYEQALSALSRTLADERGVVRRAAIQALGALAGKSLPPGSTVDDEEDALEAVETWLADQ